MDLKVFLKGLDGVFDRLRARVRGSAPKQLKLAVQPAFSLAGIYDAAARSEGDKVPSAAPAKTLLDVAQGYLDAEHASARAAATRAFASEDPEVRQRDLGEVRSRILSRVETILDSEATAARNAGGLEAIGKVAASFGIDDPCVYFVVCNDEHCCDECRRLHLMPDGVTPRVWRQSEVGAGYHRRGDQNPKLVGLHPRCRCSCVGLMPGYGFESGRVRYVARDHDELARQRG